MFLVLSSTPASAVSVDVGDKLDPRGALATKNHGGKPNPYSAIRTPAQCAVDATLQTASQPELLLCFEIVFLTECEHD